MPNPVTLLLKAAERAGSQKALAAQIPCSEPYIAMVLNGHREPGPKVLEFLGLERVTRVSYRRKRNGQ
jgi:hypothetical protein